MPEPRALTEVSMPQRSRRAPLALTSLVCLWLAACESPDSGITGPPPPAGSPDAVSPKAPKIFGEPFPALTGA